MQHTKTHDIFFSIDQPDRTLDILLALLQEIRETISLKGTLLTPLHASTILLLDADSQRVRSIASLLSSAGYQSFIATSTLEAFTLFLRGSFVPFAIVLGQYDPNTRFFLSRLLQQVMQKYRWNPPLIALHPQTRTLPSPQTDTLPPLQASQLNCHPLYNVYLLLHLHQRQIHFPFLYQRRRNNRFHILEKLYKYHFHKTKLLQQCLYQLALPILHQSSISLPMMCRVSRIQRKRFR